MTLRILATGGTFDKIYDPLSGELRFADSCIDSLLTRARTAAVVQIVMLMDSLDMTDAHREQVAQACRCAPESQLVIIHGTDTMVETASVIARDKLAKTIVLTGAMVPNALHGSDAFFNLGVAMGFAQQARHGVWIAMNGRLHAHNEVRKNRTLGRFESLGPSN